MTSKYSMSFAWALKYLFKRALKRVLELSEVFGRFGEVQWVVAVMVLFNRLTGRVYNRACCLYVLM